LLKEDVRLLALGWGRLWLLAFWISEAFGREVCCREISERAK
jgi:hypothetical protein